MMRWPLTLIGLAFVVFGIVALSGPGRIDIEDGQARFEAGRNLIDHADTALRDPRLTWNRFPGRDGKEFTGYRLPQIVVAAACVKLSDLFCEPDENRRHFAFSLHGAYFAAMIAVMFAIWFRSQGCSPKSSLIFAALGVFATPCWYYATSTFDEILTTFFAVLMVLAAAASRRHFAFILLSALAAGVLYNCKPPIVALALPALALACDPKSSRRSQLFRTGILGAGVLLGHFAMSAYEQYKFPPEVRGEYERIIREEHPPSFFGNVPEAMLDLIAGPSSGTLWYFPPCVLIGAGVLAWWQRGDRLVAGAFCLAALAIVGFVSLLVFYKGGVCWGPRYLTPLFAVGWLFAPEGARKLSPILTKWILVAGVIVQLLGLAAIPERLYVERELPTAFYLEKPWLYFHPQISHILNRPREIIDMMEAPSAPLLTPSPSPTYTLPIFHAKYFPEPQGKAAIAKYQILNGPRFWWVWMSYLHDSERFINQQFCIIVFSSITIAGILLLMMARPDS